MAYQPGPRELQLRAMREERAGRRKPTTAELRNQIAKTKGGGGKKRQGGRKR